MQQQWILQPQELEADGTDKVTKLYDRMNAQLEKNHRGVKIDRTGKYRLCTDRRRHSRQRGIYESDQSGVYLCTDSITDVRAECQCRIVRVHE